MKKLGVIGTLVWDTIHRPGPRAAFEEWGGIAYALAAFEAQLPDGWELVPIIKVGTDLSRQAQDYLRTLSRCTSTSRFIQVPEPTNRVTLRYLDDSRRTERLSGGVPGWTWPELGPLIEDLDALYINFISGWEMSLDTALLMRRGFRGPIYADAHSLFLGIDNSGLRIPQAPPNVQRWYECFDVLQMNEEEMSVAGDDPMQVAVSAMASGVQLLTVTLDRRGVVYFTTDDFQFESGKGPASGPLRTSLIPPRAVVEGDPTGCGDVFGASMVCNFLSRERLEMALGRSMDAAARNLGHQGATNLHYHLKGEIAPA